MWKSATVLEAAFLSKSMVLVTLGTGASDISATCYIPWFLRMVRSLRDLYMVDIDIPARIDLGSGMVIKDVLIQMDEEFRLKNTLIVLDVMRS